MQIKKLPLILLLIILVMAVAVPAYANDNPKNGKTPVGDNISLWDGDQEVSGPFHVEHGHFAFPEKGAFGKADFVLEIDGVEQDGRFLSYKEDGILKHTKLYNFPDGLLPGEYLFTGTWYDPCFWFSNDCDKDNEIPDPPFVVEITVTVLP
jgi:hypothetical protein